MSNYLQKCNTIQTDRLIIRKPIFDDSHALYLAYTHDPRVTRYTTWLPHKSESETMQFVARCIDAWDRDMEYNLVVRLRQKLKPIGMVRVVFNNRTQATIGYVLAHDYWNKGFATELVKGLIDFLFTHTEVTTILATCDIENKASERVMQKSGMTLQGIEPKYVIHPSLSHEPRDVYSYKIYKGRYETSQSASSSRQSTS